MFGLRDDPMMQLALLGSPLPGEGAVILGDQRLVVGGQVVVNYLDPYGCAPEVTDRTPRTHAPQNITIHTTTGQPHDPVLVPDPATETRVCELAHYQTNTDREVSWDFTVATVGLITQQNDPTRWYTWQAGNVNGYAVGIENEQGPGGVLYKPGVRAFVALCDTLTRGLKIQRMVPVVWRNGVPVPDRRVLDRFLAAYGSGSSWYGLYGHRNVTPQRGPGDPGDVLIYALLAAGYEGFDVQAGQDLDVWAMRQRELGVPATGIPGPETVAAIDARSSRFFPRFRQGLWVWRPGD